MDPTILIRCKAQEISEINAGKGWIWGYASLFENEQVARKMLELISAHPELGPAKKVKPEQAKSAPEEALEKLIAQQQLRITELPITVIDDFNRVVTDKDVAAFVQKYGIFRDEDLEPRDNFPEHIAGSWEMHGRLGRNPFALRSDEFLSAQKRFRDLVTITGNLHPEEGDILRARDLASKLGYTTPESAVDCEFQSLLQPVRVGVTFDDKVVIPALTTQRVLAGIYAHLWNLTLMRTPLRECPKCHALFIATNLRKIYCSVRHEQAAKQQRHRERRA